VELVVGSSASTGIHLISSNRPIAHEICAWPEIFRATRGHKNTIWVDEPASLHREQSKADPTTEIVRREKATLQFSAPEMPAQREAFLRIAEFS
jgi:hypothetical protein